MVAFRCDISDKFIIVRVPHESHTAIHATAKAHGLTVSGMVREMLEGKSLHEILTPVQSPA